MESFKEIKVIESAIVLTNDLQNRVIQYCQSLDDVEIIKLTANQVKLAYYPQLYSESFLGEQLEQLGVKTIEAAGRKGFFKTMLDKMAKNNKEAFGGGELECCKLHKS